MKSKKAIIGLTAVLAMSLGLNVYLYMQMQNGKALMADLQTKNADLEPQLADLETQLAGLTTELEALLSENEELTVSLEATEADRETLTAELAEAEAEIEALMVVAETPTEPVPQEPVAETLPSGSEVTTVPQQTPTAEQGVAYLDSIFGGQTGGTNSSAAAPGTEGYGGNYGSLQ